MNDITFRFGPSFLSHLDALARHTRIKRKRDDDGCYNMTLPL